MKTNSKDTSSGASRTVLRVLSVKASCDLSGQGFDLEANRFLQDFGGFAYFSEDPLSHRAVCASPDRDYLVLVELDGSPGSQTRQFKLVQIYRDSRKEIDRGYTIYVQLEPGPDGKVEINGVGEEVKDWVLVCGPPSDEERQRNEKLQGPKVPAVRGPRNSVATPPSAGSLVEKPGSQPVGKVGAPNPGTQHPSVSPTLLKAAQEAQSSISRGNEKPILSRKRVEELLAESLFPKVSLPPDQVYEKSDPEILATAHKPDPQRFHLRGVEERLEPRTRVLPPPGVRPLPKEETVTPTLGREVPASNRPTKAATPRLETRSPISPMPGAQTLTAAETKGGTTPNQHANSLPPEVVALATAMLKLIEGIVKLSRLTEAPNVATAKTETTERKVTMNAKQTKEMVTFVIVAVCGLTNTSVEKVTSGQRGTGEESRAKRAISFTLMKRFGIPAGAVQKSLKVGNATVYVMANQAKKEYEGEEAFAQVVNTVVLQATDKFGSRDAPPAGPTVPVHKPARDASAMTGSPDVLKVRDASMFALAQLDGITPEAIAKEFGVAPAEVFEVVGRVGLLLKWQNREDITASVRALGATLKQ
ncbi:MAG TPA: hypothetical protein VJH94_05030 [Candidatus Paceibacterota bacterium]